MQNQQKALFLDRDGIFIKMHYHRNVGVIDTPLVPSQVVFVPGIFDLLKHAKNMGYLLILISNQPGIGIRKINKKNFIAIKNKISQELKANSITLDGEYYCLHHPFALIKKYAVECTCRKPKTGLIDQAVKDLKIDISKSWMIGDGIYDIIGGHNAGLKTILIANITETEYLQVVESQLQDIKPTYLVKNLKQVKNLLY